MNKTLVERWRRGEPPFDGEVVAPEDYVPLAKLSTILTALTKELQSKFLEAELEVNDDWHEHDGYVSMPKPVSWSDLYASCADPVALARLERDTYVRVGFFGKPAETELPSNSSPRCFYLRVYVPDSSDDPCLDKDDSTTYTGVASGHFDLSANAETISAAMKVLTELGIVLVQQPAKSYFDSQYAG